MLQQFEEQRRRRQRVLSEIEPGALLVFSAPQTLRNNDVEHDFRQDSDFYYLTGLEEPHSALLLSTIAEPRFCLFVQPRDKQREVWDGRRVGPEGAVSDLGADAAFVITDLAEKLPELLENTERLYVTLGQRAQDDQAVLQAIRRVKRRSRSGVSWPTHLIDASRVLHEMRLFKSNEELSLMQKAARISTEGHRLAMSTCRPGMHEYELEALLFSEFRRRGSERVAYSSIVGSGPNATVLHYRHNNRRIEAGDLVLIDAGAEYGYYASDITRTFPASAQFSQAQRDLYEVVYDAQLKSIAAVRPGATLDDVHQASVRTISEGLVRHGLIEGPVDTAVQEGRYKRYFMHRTSHFLGMDVHDVGTYFVQGKQRPLAPNMVITVEPGIYVAPDDDEAPERYRGIGIRIEDDVMVTETGANVLSEGLPKSIDEVEQVCRG